MAYKQVGSSDRDPITGKWFYYATQCPTCNDKIYLADWQIQLLCDKVGTKKRNIIKRLLSFQLPKIKLEWDEEEVIAIL